MNKINYIELGATLFIPAVHKDLEAIVCSNKYPELKSVLIDTEDGIISESLDIALNAIEKLLKIYEKKKLAVFIRPRDLETLREILKLKNIDRVDGFILPKFSLSNAGAYFNLLKDYDFSVMPSIEGEELFNQNFLYELRAILLKHKKNILLVRFGLEDMLRQLKMKRSCKETIFDFSATSYILGAFIATFKSAGFAISGGVYPCFKDDDGFRKDVKRDLKEGLFSKTIIHPRQIELSNELYRVTQEELREALEISSRNEAVFNQNDKMAEVVTMKPQAQEIILRSKIYGVV
ncbi:MAG: HpcH/HpaI aldolase/citrate lyase family protein [Campylobacterota bacterium]